MREIPRVNVCCPTLQVSIRSCKPRQCLHLECNLIEKVSALVTLLKGYMIDPVKLSKTIVAIKEWQISGKCPKRALVPHEIENALNLPMVTLAPALELTGFKKCVVWGQENNKRVKRIKWVPKGVGIPKPQRGRPSYALIVSNIFNN